MYYLDLNQGDVWRALKCRFAQECIKIMSWMSWKVVLISLVWCKVIIQFLFFFLFFDFLYYINSFYSEASWWCCKHFSNAYADFLLSRSKDNLTFLGTVPSYWPSALEPVAWALPSRNLRLHICCSIIHKIVHWSTFFSLNYWSATSGGILDRAVEAEDRKHGDIMKLVML